MKYVSRILFIGGFLFALFAIPLVTLLKPVEQISIYEQRTLATAPTFSGQGVWDGSYFNEWETVLSDHIALRDTMLKAHTRLDLLLGRPVVNQMVTTEDKLLPFFEFTHWDLSALSEEAKKAAQDYQALNEAIQSYGGYFLYVGLPQHNTYFSSSYPEYLDSRQWQTTVIRTEFSSAMAEASVPFLNMTEQYQAMGNPENYYFKTDHHYSYHGAYAAYQTILEIIHAQTGWDIPVMEKEDLIWETLPNPFLGSSNRKLYGLFPTDDKVEIAYPKTEIPFSRTDNGNPVPAQLYTIPEQEDATANYTTYMGGDIGETILQTNRPSLKTALIVGDSFTNALETLLWTGFDETRSLDYRHYKGESLIDYVQTYQPDVVLIVRDESLYLSLEGNGAVF